MDALTYQTSKACFTYNAVVPMCTANQHRSLATASKPMNEPKTRQYVSLEAELSVV